MKNSLFLKLFATSLAVSAVTLTTLASTEVFSEVHGSPETQLMSIPNSNEWFILSEDNDLSGIMLPESNVSVAEAVVLVSRMNAIYNNNEIDMVSGDKGYDMYIDYAIENGLIQEGQFTNYDRNIMRYEFVQMFANALPAHCYQPINDINSIPDVAETEEYYDDLMMLYEAGVVMGTDEYGSFLATNPIKKYEMAQIINRAVLPENRKSGTLSEFGARKPAVYLIEDLDMWCEPGGFKHIDSGWTYENPLSSSISNLEYSTKQLVDFSNEEKVTIRKEVTTVDTGIVTLEVSYNVSNLGSRLYFEDLEGNLLFELFNDDNVFYAIGDKKTSTQYDFIDGRVILKVEMDLDSREARVIINSTDVGVYDMSTSASDLSRLIISTTEEDEVCITVDSVFLYWNYDVNENFYHGKAGTVPFGWQVDNALLKTINSDYDKISFNINGQGSASKTFNKVSDTFVYETYFVVPEGQDATLAIMNGSKTALAVNAKDGVITTADGTLVRNYNTNVWQQLRVEADTAKDTALVKINGKKCLTVPFTEDGIDNIVISTAGTGDFYFDDVKVFNTFDYPDYCPVPVPVNDDEWYSGMSVCSLWREGSHFGWDSISPYEDITPVLGYYDEGIAEVADWEIKFMVEHGYDYQRFCWYQGGFNDNIKKPSTCDDAIHDGYFNAKYSDMLDFSIMWENVGYDGTMDDFCNGIWPYWVDWYLTDERYFCIDNKPVISIYSHQQFMKTMDGTVEGVKAAINFMDAECKNLGFDGVIVYVSDSSSNAAFNQELAECGYDAKAAYHFDELAYTADYQKTRMLDAFDAGHITLSASVGIGFNNIGWTETRTPLATAEEFEEILRWSKEVYLPMYADRAVDDWHTKSILTNTWNEYGEGHYVFPSGLNGFGYMDAHRRVFSSVAGTEDSEHFDVVPTDNQKARLGYLYSARRIPMRKTYLVEEDYSKYERVKTWDFESSEDCNLWKVLAKVTDLGYDSEEKALVGTTTTNDGHISIKSLPENYFNADDARWLHIRIKIDPCESNRIDVFFSNVSSDSANASIAAYIPAYSDGEYHDYYFDLSSIATWDGEIRGIRFDPASAIAKFYIKTIEFISEKTVNFKSFEIDGVAFTMDEDNYSVVDDELFICANPSAGFYNLNQFYYEWNRWDGTLLIRA
ncbi:MAG: hypothetical protein J6K12_06130, partial [Clostridia bacterium]|nr:hypothetical protein [Clostridia bacterium]